jgi:probable HAF family extracellular repeat protein
MRFYIQVLGTILGLSAAMVFGQTATNEAGITFTTIDVPGMPFTALQGINTAGDIVGYYATSSDPQGPYHAFLWHDGTFTFFDYPGSQGTLARRINDAGLIVGYAVFRNGNVLRGFSYDGTNWKTIMQSGSTATWVEGVNNHGVIVGGVGSVGSTRGFEFKGGQFKDVTPPGSHRYVFDSGLNDLGTIVGSSDFGGFSYSNGTFTHMDFPGSQYTEVHDINDSGVMVGQYEMPATGYSGFWFLDGTYTTLNYPGALWTFAEAINSLNQVVGYYELEGGSVHGFLTSPVVAAKR